MLYMQEFFSSWRLKPDGMESTRPSFMQITSTQNNRAERWVLLYGLRMLSLFRLWLEMNNKFNSFAHDAIERAVELGVLDLNDRAVLFGISTILQRAAVDYTKRWVCCQIVTYRYSLRCQLGTSTSFGVEAARTTSLTTTSTLMSFLEMFRMWRALFECLKVFSFIQH